MIGNLKIEYRDSWDEKTKKPDQFIEQPLLCRQHKIFLPVAIPIESTVSFLFNHFFSYISEDGKILGMHLESFGRIDSCIFVGATAIENKARAYADFF